MKPGQRKLSRAKNTRRKSIADKQGAVIIECMDCDTHIDEEEDSIMCYECRKWSNSRCTTLTEKDLKYLNDTKSARLVDIDNSEAKETKTISRCNI